MGLFLDCNKIHKESEHGIEKWNKKEMKSFVNQETNMVPYTFTLAFLSFPFFPPASRAQTSSTKKITVDSK